jgi:hypothetical protein
MNNFMDEIMEVESGMALIYEILKSAPTARPSVEEWLAVI